MEILKANDRVLLLALPADEQLIGIAQSLTAGLVVGLAAEEQVYRARRLLADFDNVMFAPADPEGEIPWRDSFFTVIYAPMYESASDEILRVLSPGGVAYLASSECRK